MLKFYVSMRPIQMDRILILPHEDIAARFKGLDVSCEPIVGDRNVDGRELYKLEIGANSSYSDADLAAYKAIVLEGLSAWSVHEKSVSSAVALANLISGKVWSAAEDGVSIVAPALAE